MWNVIRMLAHRRQVYHPDIRVGLMGAKDLADQAELARQCVADRAVAIGATLVAPEAMAEALLEAWAAGVSVASCSSGVQDFQDVGSIRRVSVDETRAGMQAGERPDLGRRMCVAVLAPGLLVPGAVSVGAAPSRC